MGEASGTQSEGNNPQSKAKARQFYDVVCTDRRILGRSGQKASAKAQVGEASSSPTDQRAGNVQI